MRETTAIYCGLFQIDFEPAAMFISNVAAACATAAVGVATSMWLRNAPLIVSEARSCFELVPVITSVNNANSALIVCFLQIHLTSLVSKSLKGSSLFFC
jgi:hypothetical protein